MRRVTMLVVLVAALVVASSTGGALLAQNTHKHSTQKSTTQPSTTSNNTTQSQPQSIGSPDQLGEKAVTTGKDSSGAPAASSSTIYGPYSFDISTGSGSYWGLHNGLYTYGYLVPAGQLPASTYVLFCHSPGTGTECFRDLNTVHQWSDPNNDSSFSMFSYEIQTTPYGCCGTGGKGRWWLQLYDGSTDQYISTASGPHYVQVY